MAEEELVGETSTSMMMMLMILMQYFEVGVTKMMADGENGCAHFSFEYVISYC